MRERTSVCVEDILTHRALLHQNSSTMDPPVNSELKKDIINFKRKSLTPSETITKNIQPTKEDIEQEKKEIQECKK
ncbi:hypothetical protein JOB18_028568 [Solea senegalensis]|uniref:Thymosin beta n=1 Tax=Solea senegalensis TaxID=28829 RepID=A0AAV6SM81_SOLSE|nr:hypothetical protein JOB18_028568 [Solea senegalensis]